MKTESVETGGTVKERIREALEGTTPGPWYPNTSHGPKTYVWADVDDDPVLVAVCRSRDAMIPNPSGAPGREAEANVALIASIHDLLTDALAEIERLEGRVWQLNRAGRRAYGAWVRGEDIHGPMTDLRHTTDFDALSDSKGGA